MNDVFERAIRLVQDLAFYSIYIWLAVLLINPKEYNHFRVILWSSLLVVSFLILKINNKIKSNKNERNV